MNEPALGSELSLSEARRQLVATTIAYDQMCRSRDQWRVVAWSALGGMLLFLVAFVLLVR